MKRIAFISHSSADKTVAEEVRRFLEENGIPCWIAPRDVTPGKNYGAAILDAIDECSIFVLLLTRDSNKSGQVVREVERAASSNSIIIPFRVQDVQPSRDLEFYVSATHWLDAVSKPFDKHLHELLGAIRNWQETNGGKESSDRPADSPAPPLRSISAHPSYLGGHGVILIIGGLVALFFCIVPGNVRLRHKPAPREVLAPIASATPLSSARPEMPRPMETASPLETPASPAPSFSINPSETVPAGGRRRPGALLHQAISPEISPSTFGTSSPAPMKPGQPIVTTLSRPAPSIGEIVASSESQIRGEIRKASQAFDGIPGTSWVGEGDGIGKSLRVHFKAPADIASISILAALGSDPQFEIRNRLHTVRVTFSDNTNQVLTLADRRKFQHFKLPHPVTTDWVQFEILSVYRGTKINHTPIFEIAFNREPE
jgi:hypothetical protein